MSQTQWMLKNLKWTETELIKMAKAKKRQRHDGVISFSIGLLFFCAVLEEKFGELCHSLQVSTKFVFKVNHW